MFCMLYYFFWVIHSCLYFMFRCFRTLFCHHRWCKLEELSVLYHHKCSWQVSILHSFILGVSCLRTHFVEFVELQCSLGDTVGQTDWCPMWWVSLLMRSACAVAGCVISVGLAWPGWVACTTLHYSTFKLNCLFSHLLLGCTCTTIL